MCTVDLPAWCSAGLSLKVHIFLIAEVTAVHDSHYFKIISKQIFENTLFFNEANM